MLKGLPKTAIVIQSGDKEIYESFVFHNPKANVYVVEELLSGCYQALDDGSKFLLNLQSKSISSVPFLALESYLNHNQEVGFVKLNENICGNNTQLTPEYFIEKFSGPFEFQSCIFRVSFLAYLESKADSIADAFRELNLKGARVYPQIIV